MIGGDQRSVGGGGDDSDVGGEAGDEPRCDLGGRVDRPEVPGAVAVNVTALQGQGLAGVPAAVEQVLGVVQGVGAVVVVAQVVPEVELAGGGLPEEQAGAGGSLGGGDGPGVPVVAACRGGLRGERVDLAVAADTVEVGVVVQVVAVGVAGDADQVGVGEATAVSGAGQLQRVEELVVDERAGVDTGVRSVADRERRAVAVAPQDHRLAGVGAGGVVNEDVL
nr:hypothetical protein [Micromonospora provocatoris]